MHKNLKEWFRSGKKYYKGIELYRAVGGRTPVARFEKYLTKNYVPENISALLERELISGYDLINTGTFEPQHFEKKLEENEPGEVTRKRKQGLKYLRERAYVHAQMSASEDARNRYELASRIMQLTKEIDRIYGAIKLYESTGDLPESQSEEVKRLTVEKFKKYLSMRSGISILRKRIKDAKANGMTKLTAQLEKELLSKTAERNEIKKDLGL